MIWGTRTVTEFRVGLWTITAKSRLAFNQIVLSEPTIQPREVRDSDGFDSVFATLSKQRPDGLYAHPTGPLIFANQKRLAGFALKSRLPSVYYNREAVDAGGLMYYGADFADSYRRVAYYVDRILKGAKPADLPVEQPTKFEFVINLKTAKQIGLTIPPDLLARATKIIR
jgi:putative tryptophan/tyrosine transport system substrate-binding protein